MRTICSWSTVLVLLMASQPAIAQSRVFVSGGVFAETKRFSGDTSGAAMDATSTGGGGTVGLLVTDRWDVRGEVEAGAITTVTEPLLPPIAAFQSRTRNRIISASALLGFHPVARPRAGVAVLAGLSFLHVTTQFDSIPVGLVVEPHTQVDNVAAPTLGADLTIALVRHLSVVAALRAHAFTLRKDMPGGFALRPGLGVQWTF